jgi:triacylglycerol lipase
LIDDYRPSQKKRRVLISKELLASASLGLLYPFGLGQSDRKASRIKDQRTVVMIHGWGANRSNLYPLAAYLRLQGVKKILFYDYPSRLGVERAAVHLRDYLKKHVKGGRIDLVCHSMGGIVARVYLQLLGGHRRVDHCITLGTPHKGTYNAYWIPTKVGDELRPDSDLIKKLEKTEYLNSRTQVTSIVAGSDNIIIPRVNSGHQNSIHVPDVGHLGMLLSRRVMSEVLSCLRPKRNFFKKAS